MKKEYYWSIKTNEGYCWLKTDLEHLSADKVFLSLRLDNIISPIEEIIYIKKCSKKSIGEFNLKAFTYSYNMEASE